VAHAHAQLIVHRDLKPSNVLVNTAGNAKLLDFGIALALESTDESAPATRVFTPEYAAPEQLRGERVTTATDVHALGLILYELVCQRRLPVLERGSHNEEWTGAELARMASTHPATIAQSATSDAAFNFREISAALRGDLGRIIAHALNPEPGQRYASVALLREDLARWLDHRPLTIVRPSALYVVRRFCATPSTGHGTGCGGSACNFRPGRCRPLAGACKRTRGKPCASGTASVRGHARLCQFHVSCRRSLSRQGPANHRR
jgi:serine/threonine-protein kinase